MNLVICLCLSVGSMCFVLFSAVSDKNVVELSCYIVIICFVCTQF